MAAKTLSQLLQDVGALIDQDTDIPDGTELTNRVNFLNQAQQAWADAYEWDELRVTNSIVTFALSTASVGLPTNFKKLMSPLVDVANSREVWQQIPPSDRLTRLNGDKWTAIAGDSSRGRYLLLSGLPSGASLVYDYQCTPSSLATLADIAVCPNPQFLVAYTLTKIMESRSDPRFPQKQAEADRYLKEMLENQDAGSGGSNNRIVTWDRANNFRVGRD